MRSFTDAGGRVWELAITVGSARRARDKTGVHLYSLIDDGAKALGALFDDPIKFTEVVYYLCKESASLTPDDFCEAFTGDTLSAAADAFFEELVDFFPDPKARESLRKLKAKSKLLQVKLLEKTEANLDSLDLDSLAETMSASPGSSPGKLVSTPDPSPSVS